MKIRSLLLVCLLLGSGFIVPLYSQSTDTVYSDENIPPPIEFFNGENDDTINQGLPLFDPPYFSKDSLDNIKKGKAYNYMSNLDSALKSIQLKSLTDSKPTELPPPGFFSSKLVITLLWAMAVLAILFVLYQLLGSQKNPFRRNKRLAGNQLVKEKNHIPEASAMMLAQEASAKGDYHSAVGYLHKYVLQLMEKKQLIIMEPQKTNYQYLSALRQQPFYSDFATLTLQYEYVWFGDFELNKDQYQHIEKGFRTFIGTWL